MAEIMSMASNNISCITHEQFDAIAPVLVAKFSSKDTRVFIAFINVT